MTHSPKVLEAIFFGLMLSVIGSIVMFITKRIYKIKKCCNAECPDMDKHYILRRMIGLFVSGIIFYYLFFCLNE